MKLIATNSKRLYTFDNYCQVNIHKLKTTGELIRDKREKKGLLLRHVSAQLDIDTAILSKIERGERKATRDQITKLADILELDKESLLIQYLTRYSPEQTRRHNVRPGITGWAQVNGRNALSWEEKFKLDVEYVEKVSFSLDLKILWMTFLNVVQRKGISADGHATMEEFKGSEG